MAQLRYLEEMAVNLRRSGFEVGRIEDQHLPVSWNGSYLCRVSGRGSVLYRQDIVDALGAQAELNQMVDIVDTTHGRSHKTRTANQRSVCGSERTSSEMSEFSCLHGNEGYGACEDEGLGLQ